MTRLPPRLHAAKERQYKNITKDMCCSLRKEPSVLVDFFWRVDAFKKIRDISSSFLLVLRFVKVS